MKRIIAVLALIALLVSFTGVPVSAATANPPALAGHETSHLPEVELMAIPTDMERVEPMEAASLNEAINVPGGTLEFDTFAMPAYGYYAWVVEGDYAKSTNAGQDGDAQNPYGAVTQSQVTAYVDMEEDQAIRFRFKVSCQNAENTDCLALFVDRNLVTTWYGEMDWTTYTYPVSAGEHELTWVYNKDDSISEGEDTAYLDDVEVTSFQPYTLVHSQELDDALNVEGGKLEFYTPEEAANGYFPWVPENGSAKSTNNGIDAETSYSPPSISTVSTTVNAGEGEVLTFRCRVSSEEQADSLRFYMDGERLKQWSGEQDWAVYILALEPGEHVFKWNYDKDYIGSDFEDTAWLDDVCVAAPVAATGIEIQETATVAGYRSVALTWNVLPDTAFNREVSFASSDESIATVNENGIVTGISQGEATITVTTKDGGFTDTCLVTVTADEPPANLYGFMYAEFVDNDGWFRDCRTWCSFTDTHPEDVTNYCGYKNREVILVFDGYRVKGSRGERFQYHNLYVVYTRENETGDMYIESLVRGIGKHDRVWVATSDSLIQLSAFRTGVLRLSARELKAEVDSACGEMTALLQAMDRAQTVARQQEKRGQIPEKLLRLLPE